jgi:hypothetical protein
MKCGARKEVEQRGPVHLILNPRSDIRHWEGSIWWNFGSNVGEATEGRKPKLV